MKTDCDGLGLSNRSLLLPRVAGAQRAGVPKRVKLPLPHLTLPHLTYITLPYHNAPLPYPIFSTLYTRLTRTSHLELPLFLQPPIKAQHYETIREQANKDNVRDRVGTIITNFTTKLTKKAGQQLHCKGILAPESFTKFNLLHRGCRCCLFAQHIA